MRMKLNKNIETIYLDDYTKDGIIIEKEFRKKIDKTDWNLYKNKKVLIKGCASVSIPTWAYLIIAAKLSHVAKIILYGEPCSAFEIFKKN